MRALLAVIHLELQQHDRVGGHQAEETQDG